MMINVGHPKGSQQLEQVLSATLRAVFPTVARDPSQPTNTWLVATSSTLQPAMLVTRGADALRRLDTAIAARIGTVLRGGTVYTDDRAPVEWLIDDSFVRYASGR